MAGPYEGVTVLELSTMITCSLATMMFAQQGAHVIKIEPKKIGDPMRMLGSQKGGISGLFHNCNRGKQSLALDLKTQSGQDIVSKLAQDADILIHNYRPGVMDRLGLGSETLRAQNPRLIYVAVTGFGIEGPLAGAPAYDPVVQGLAGFTHVQGGRGERALVSNLICDKTTAYTAAQAAGAALYQRERTGTGQHIDLSMLDAGLAFLWPDGMMHITLLDDDALEMPPMSEYFRTTKALDGYIVMSALKDEDWAVICDLVGRPDLKTDERFSTPRARAVNGGQIAEEMENVSIQKTVDEALAILEEHDVPASRCMSVDELASHPQIKAIGALEQQDHPLMGTLQSPAAPIMYDGERSPPAAPSPALGAHTQTILEAAGYTADDIASLRKEGVL